MPKPNSKSQNMEAKSALTLLGFRKRVRKASLPPRIQSICRSRAQKRWSALLTQTRSRIGCNIRGRLGEDNWEKFVLYAETNYKESFIRSLTPHSGLLCCSGKIDGSQCANNLRIDLNAVSDVNLKTLLPNMHMTLHTFATFGVELCRRHHPPGMTAYAES